MLQLQKFYSVEQLINYVKVDINLGDRFCLYTKEADSLELDGESLYWIDDYPEVDDDDREIYPENARENNLHYCYSGQQFADVIYVAQETKPDVTVEEYIQALNHYSEHDNFKVF